MSIREEYDAIVIGAGASGGIVACVLAEAGQRVLLLDRGRHWDVREVSRDHLRNHRLSLYGHNTGPGDGHPRVSASSGREARTVFPQSDGYHNNAMAVGGGTLVYGAQAWRFLPQDFRMASLYGKPAGSSLADWPIGYEDLAPYYERAEWEIGVAGVAHRTAGPRARDYPMPPQADTLQRRVLREGANKLGWESAPVPILINSTPYLNRGACERCGHCVGFACPWDAKNGSQNTVLPRALATGRCTLRPEAQVAKIHTDGRGRATGITYFCEQDASPTAHVAHAKRVILCAGAIESARLLLLSADAKHPRGLGNDSDHVGRHLQGHYYAGAHGLFAQDVKDGLGPGISIATCQFNHGNPGVIGGAMLADEFVPLPIIFWKRVLPPDLPRWGKACKDFMRINYNRVLEVKGPVQEIPSPLGRVTLDPEVRDRFGLPVVRLSGTQHEETLRTCEVIRKRSEEWLRASGAVRVWSKGSSRPHLSGGQHQAGTCRMSADPADGVTDRWGRVHGMENLFVADGGLHVTNGGFNPVLTIMANAFRVAEHVAKAAS